tara:strand:+ start:357 stop:635 length:279 start_codon:yes stop_codon:yes gene_type:complete
MPYYQIEIFRTVQDQTVTTVQASNEQEAEQFAGQLIDDLDWHLVDEQITFDSVSISQPENTYTSMSSLLSQPADAAPQVASTNYTPLTNQNR